MDAKRDEWGGGGGGGGGGAVWSTGTNFFLPYYAEISVIYEKKQSFFFTYLSKMYAVLYINSSALTKWHDLSLCQTCKLRILYVFGSCFRTLAVIVVSDFFYGISLLCGTCRNH